MAVALNKHEVRFQYAEDMVFHNDFLPLHENGMIITAFDKDGKESYRQTYYSIGGGFIVDEAHFGVEEKQTIEVPFPYKNAKDIIKYCNDNGLSISNLMYQKDRKSTRLNSSHLLISYAVFCLKKKNVQKE